ncbi:MAG: EAL domain-containing protein [Marinobacterium sp.]|nr:EAL domain-containing protein [Marinobacterium sp.]
MNSLRTKVFIFFVALLLLVQALSLWTIYQANQAQEQEQVSYRLDTAVSVFRTQYESRSYYLDAFAQTAARDYGLKQVFGDDPRSFMVALNNHRKRIKADMAIAIGADQKVIGQLLRRPDSEGGKVRLGPGRGELFSGRRWLQDTASAALCPLDDDIYQVSFAPLKSGAQVIGWVGFGYRIDQSLAQQFADITDLNIDFMAQGPDSRWRTLASAVNSGNALRVADQGEKIINQQIPSGLIATTEQIGDAEGQQVVAVVYGSRSNLLETIRNRWWHLLALESGIVLLAMLAAFLLASSISRPVRRLVQQARYIASGNYDTPVEVTGSSELGQLAREFNQMQQAVLVREQAISHRLYHDSLTELPNRNYLRQQLEQMQAHDSCFTLFHLDIRRTKTVNDTLGYLAGDKLIQEVGKRLAELPQMLEFGHLGADEFVMVVEGTAKTEINQWCERITAAMEAPLGSEDIQLHLQLHGGIACAPEDACSAAQLLQKADTALSHGKRSGKPFQRYETSMDADAARRLSLVNDLKAAIEQDQLVLFYQPKLDIRQGVISHLEALVRWIHPEQGMVPPDAFISIAEQTGQIDNLTRWVIREAARQYSVWAGQGLKLSIAVNISAENLKNQRFTAELREIWQQFELPVDALSLEVTESAVVDDPACAVAMLCEIREAGIKLSIDDYGTGYSSLAQLKQLPVDELKIDRSFVDRVACDTDDQIIVRSTIRMAHDMGLSVVAEGIEDQQTLDWLAQQQCDLAQGYFISRPQPAAELERWLEQSDWDPRKIKTSLDAEQVEPEYNI